ncbi:MAG: PDZ domain-containing protein [Saprospiraceae bacterium]|nr:PDZ domain-containing protein [Saprospiraceae bacterium]
MNLLVKKTIFYTCCLCFFLSNSGPVFGARSIRIPFRYVQSFIILEVNLEGIIPLKLIFDTGAEHHLLFESKYTDIFKDIYSREVKVLGSDLQQEMNAWVTKPLNLFIEGMGDVSLPLLVLQKPVTGVSEIIGEEIHGILSAAHFKNYFIEINYSSHIILLHEKLKEEKLKKYESCSMHLYRNKPYITVEMKTQEDNTAVKLNLLVDTGAGLSLLIYTGHQTNVTLPAQLVPGKLGSGIGGLINGYVGRTKSFDFCAFQFPELLTYFQELDTELMEREKDRKQGIIGNQILERFRVIFDYNHSVVYFKSIKNYNAQLRFDRSGITCLAGGPLLKNFYVSHLVDNSPAANAGIKEGDLILKLNSTGAEYLNLNTIQRRLSNKEGKRIRLKVLREGKKLEFTFTLKDLL